MRTRRGLLLGLFLVAACGCGPRVGVTPTTTTLVSPSTGSMATVGGAIGALPLGAVGCSPPSPFVVSEVRGTAGAAQLFGLVGAQRPIRAGIPVKIVWRMTGVGDLVASATGPDGSDAPLTFGPERHGWSTYDRPGDEWGTGYLFPEPGCWRLHLQRDDAQGDVWLVVEP